MLKRFFSVLLACCLVFTFALPVSASEYKDVSGPTIVELKNAFEYKAYLDSKLVSTVEIPNYWSTGGTSLEWRFTPSVSNKMNSVVVCMQMGNTSPSSFQIYLNGSYKDMMLLKKEGQYYYYRYTAASSFMTTNGVRFKATFDTTYSASFNMISVYGITENSKNVGDVNVSYELYNVYSYPDEFEVYRSYSGVDFLPTFYEESFPCSSDYIEEYEKYPDCQDFGLFKWQFTIPDPYVSSVSFLVYAAEELYDAGLYIYDNDADTVSAHVPVTVEPCGSSMYNLYTDFDVIHPIAYIVSADLSGFDMTNKDIYFTHKVSAYPNSASVNRANAVFTFLWAIEYVPQVSETPWYISFANWLKTQYNNITTVITNGFSSVVGWLSSITQDIREFGDNVKENFENTLFMLQDIYQALTDGQGKANDFNSELETQRGELEEITDAMDSVTTPNVEDIELDFSGLKTGDNGEDFSLVFQIFFSNEIFLGMVLITVSLALVAYGLYGKR